MVRADSDEVPRVKRDETKDSAALQLNRHLKDSILHAFMPTVWCFQRHLVCGLLHDCADHALLHLSLVMFEENTYPVVFMQLRSEVCLSVR